jgi:plasmid stabilization system protein ParE
MKSGYNILWTDHALAELEATIEYLQNNWSESDLKNFARKLDDTIVLISQSPTLFPQSKIKKGVHRAIVAKHNTLYYKVSNDEIRILSFFSHRQSEKRRKL